MTSCCAPIGCGCSTKSVRPRRRWLTFPRLKGNENAEEGSQEPCVRQRECHGTPSVLEAKIVPCKATQGEKPCVPQGRSEVRTMGLSFRRRQGRGPRRHARAAWRQGCWPCRDGELELAGAARLHHHHRGLHALLRPRQELSEG